MKTPLEMFLLRKKYCHGGTLRRMDLINVFFHVLYKTSKGLSCSFLPVWLIFCFVFCLRNWRTWKKRRSWRSEPASTTLMTRARTKTCWRSALWPNRSVRRSSWWSWSPGRRMCTDLACPGLPPGWEGKSRKFSHLKRTVDSNLSFWNNISF